MNEQQNTLSKAEIFIQGFFLRLASGLSVIGMFALLKPHVFLENSQPRLFVALGIYLCICIGGGILDCEVQGIEDKRVYNKITRKKLLRAVLGITIFAYFVLVR